MPIVHPNTESEGGTLTYTEWNAAHTISAASLDLSSSVNIYALNNTLRTDDNLYIEGNLTVNGAISPAGFSTTGYNTISAGSTVKAITHGFGSSPSIVLISWRSDSGGKRWWISGITSTQFTVAIDSVYASNITFNWGAA